MTHLIGPYALLLFIALILMAVNNWKKRHNPPPSAVILPFKKVRKPRAK